MAAGLHVKHAAQASRGLALRNAPNGGREAHGVAAALARGEIAPNARTLAAQTHAQAIPELAAQAAHVPFRTDRAPTRKQAREQLRQAGKRGGVDCGEVNASAVRR
jgi:hypothetical protein